MGEDISEECFTPEDFRRFAEGLDRETERLGHWLRSREAPGTQQPRLGFEIEAWLIDRDCEPLAENEAFLELFDSPMATLELARFNVEINSSVFRTGPDCFCMILSELSETLRRAQAVARQLGGDILMAGSLPTLTPRHLGLRNMSRRTRYRALNSAVLERRAQRPLRLEIEGQEHLSHVHSDVMLEAAATSFQIHLETQPAVAHRVYNAALAASGPVLAASGNTPFLFGRLLWEETRIPLFEQAVEVGGFGDSARGPVRRVTFGSGYLRESIAEAFIENREHFPILLPSQLADNDPSLPHLRLHNGTIWRWNRPILGIDADGGYNLRIEHRSLPAGPTLEDMLANTAFLLGLIEHLVAAPGSGAGELPFASARDNFYAAARYGLKSRLRWEDQAPLPARQLIQQVLLPCAADGLDRLGIDASERDHLLGTVAARVQSGQTGSVWQQQWVDRHGRDMVALTRAYHALQGTGRPVHTWSP
ncbi:glutamate--cysteine ligase [Thioalkalivibrio sp.]|uniref:glutamate--cysteine ligase n=1 Tax=Thioalkalivibrio sp. TaxID=2093813 RepID=UPI003975FB39